MHNDNPLVLETRRGKFVALCPGEKPGYTLVDSPDEADTFESVADASAAISSLAAQGLKNFRARRMGVVGGGL